MKIPQSSKVAVIGAACNVSHTIENLVTIIERSFRDFLEIRFFIVEGNSSDDTKYILKKLENKGNFYSCSIEQNNILIKYKTERIAAARNHALEKIRNSNFNFDYLVVADLDEINLGLTFDSVMSNWEFRNWAGMFANQPEGYYDIYALKHEIWNTRDYISDYDELIKYFNHNIALYLSMNSKRIKIPISNPIIPVLSAFGGIAIYDYQFVNSETSYRGLDENNNPICEHLSFNENIRKNGGSLFINPKFTNTIEYNSITRIKAWIFEKYFRKK